MKAMKIDELPPEMQGLFQRLNASFDERYQVVGPLLQQGLDVNLIFYESDYNRLYGREFPVYLAQRAALEGWEFKPEKVEIKFVDDDTMPFGEKGIACSEAKAELGFVKEGKMYRTLDPRELNIQELLIRMLQARSKP